MDEFSIRKVLKNKHLFGGYVLLLVAAAAIVITYGGSMYSEALQYERDVILAGQIWRLLTAPLVHLTWSHALMNVGALMIIWGLFGKVFSNRAWVYITLACSLGISAGLLILNPGISWYVGLSGVLHGYFSAGAIAERQTYKSTSMVMLLLLFGKLLWEQIFGPLPGSAAAAGGKVVVDTHLYGAICGLVPGWLLGRDRDIRAKIKHH